ELFLGLGAGEGLTFASGVGYLGHYGDSCREPRDIGLFKRFSSSSWSFARARQASAIASSYSPCAFTVSMSSRCRAIQSEWSILLPRAQWITCPGLCLSLPRLETLATAARARGK